MEENALVRTDKSISTQPSKSIIQDLIEKHPACAVEFELIGLTGPRLADCLTGKADAARILFANSRSQQIFGTYYTTSPQLSCATDLMLHFIDKLFSWDTKKAFKIIEVGGGFGGTTRPLTRLLSAAGCKVSYTFTDISSKLVKNARSSFS